jgi:hypothetical protein
MAITQRTYARVVFPSLDTKTQQDMWYRTYAVMTNRVNTPAAAAGWAYVSKWEYLPVGVIFQYGNAPTVGSLDNINSLKAEKLPFPTTASLFPPPGTLDYIEFGPTGAATGVGVSVSDSVLAITEGFVTLGTPTRTALAGANVTVINVNSIIGHIQVTRP